MYDQAAWISCYVSSDWSREVITASRAKALDELEADDLDSQDAVEAVLNAQTITKVVRSTSPDRESSHEKLYVIEGFNYSGALLYTKGKITRQGAEEIYYFFVSAKRSRFTD